MRLDPLKRAAFHSFTGGLHRLIHRLGTGAGLASEDGGSCFFRSSVRMVYTSWRGTGVPEPVQIDRVKESYGIIKYRIYRQIIVRYELAGMRLLPSTS